MISSKQLLSEARTRAQEERAKAQKLRDGRWHPLRSGQSSGLYHARIGRWTGRRWELDRCPHSHRTRPAADKCARRGASNRNRKDTTS